MARIVGLPVVHGKNRPKVLPRLIQMAENKNSAYEIKDCVAGSAMVVVHFWVPLDS